MPPTRLFEHLLTEAHARELRNHPHVQHENIDAVESPERIARHVARELQRALAHEKNAERQATIANDLLARLRQLAPPGPPRDQDIDPPPRLLLSTHDGAPPTRTVLPFGVTTVLTRAHDEPSIGHELAREIATADRIDALVSFVTVSGVRALRDALERHARDGRGFRLLTTTYTGATDAEAVEAIAGLPCAEVRVSYDARRTRLHAKAWLFSRQSGLDTAYVGSANLSASALFHGHEWMAKLSACDLPAVVAKLRGTFETLWNDPEFEPFDPAREDHRTRLRAALSAEHGGRLRDNAPLAFFHLTPYPFQSEILDRLQAERDLHGRFRNLVVAATGTGKTVVAAFDYHRTTLRLDRRPRLLFLAHRKEILNQALATFRNVLRDGSFGELLVDGESPTCHDHLFASIQSFNTQRMLDRLGPDHWDHVIIDECHHVPAESYRTVVESIRPALLVGLTATPERTDGQSLLRDFDGSVAAELRLWHALERQLLVPFEYYGISDNTDLRGVRWSRGAYATDELEHLYTGNDARAALVLEQTARRVGNLRNMRALGFCVSVPHAEFMARRFTDAGIPSLAVHGGSDRDTRDQAPGKLRARDVNVLFTCDLYNEGVDLPFVDTLLLLRPTSSATLFLQQLGRGLRIAHGKDSCLVLDFIGQHREDFRFDKPLSALTGISRGALQAAVDQGFPTLPSGCHLSLDRVARDQILQSLKRTLRGGMSRLVEELRTVASRLGSDVSLRDYLDETGREPGEVFTKELSWSRLRRAAGLPAPAEGNREDDFRGRLRHLLHVDDPDRLRLFRALDRVPNDRLTQRRVLMLAYLLFDHADEKLTANAFLEMLREHPAIASDLRALSEVLQGRVALAGAPPPPDPEWPLSLHRRYHRREILTAIGRWTEVAKPASREGVVRIESAKVELLFVTLDKSEKRFSPTTSYEDYAISAELFHWQSQSGVSPESPTGRRYVEQERNGWRFLLFVRSTVHDLAYTYLGPVHYVSHVGSRPMSITWRLQSPIPGRWLTRFERLAG